MAVCYSSLKEPPHLPLPPPQSHNMVLCVCRQYEYTCVSQELRGRQQFQFYDYEIGDIYGPKGIRNVETKISVTIWDPEIRDENSGRREVWEGGEGN